MGNENTNLFACYYKEHSGLYSIYSQACLVDVSLGGEMGKTWGFHGRSRVVILGSHHQTYRLMSTDL